MPTFLRQALAWLFIATALLLSGPATTAAQPVPTTHAAVALRVTPVFLPVGSTFAWVGDGLLATSGGVGSGAANMAHQFQQMMAGRVQPAALPIMGKSGTTIKTTSGSNYAWIYPYAIDAAAAEQPDILLIGTMGHNENVLSTNPVGSAALQDWKDAVGYAYFKFRAYNGKLFVVVATAASTIAGETTYRDAVWAEQAAFVAGLASHDPRVLFVPLSGMVPSASYSVDSGANYTHLDERGATYAATAVTAVVGPHVDNKTPDQIVDMIVAGTYPLMGGAQLDSDTGLAGTGGTLTGPGVTGTIATSKAIANTTGATGITVAQTSTSSGRTKTVVTFGAATATSSNGRVLVNDKSNISVTATPGQYVMTGAIMRAGSGYWNFGSDWNGGLFGAWGGGANSLAANGKAGAGAVAGMDTLIFSNPLSVYGNSTTYTGKRGFALYWPSGSTLTGTFETERWFTYLVSERLHHAPYYLGDLADANGGRLLVTTQALRLTGPVSNAAGGTLRFEPGLWTPRGLLEADFVARRIYDCPAYSATISDPACSLLTTLSNSTWTYVVGAGAVATGHVLVAELDVSNGIGGTVTARSASASSITVSRRRPIRQRKGDRKTGRPIRRRRALPPLKRAA